MNILNKNKKPDQKNESKGEKKPFLSRINLDEPFKHDFGIDAEIYHYNRDTHEKNYFNVGISTNGILGGTLKVIAMTLGQISTLRRMFVDFGTIDNRKLKKAKAKDAVDSVKESVDASVNNAATAPQSA